MISENSSLILRNARVRMSGGSMSLQVDKWGKLELSGDAFTFDLKKDRILKSFRGSMET